MKKKRKERKVKKIKKNILKYKDKNNKRKMEDETKIWYCLSAKHTDKKRKRKINQKNENKRIRMEIEQKGKRKGEA